MATFIELCRDVRRLAAVPGTGPATVVNQEGVLGNIVTYVRDAWSYIQSKHLESWEFLKGEQFFVLVPEKARYTHAEISQGSGLPDQPQGESVPIHKIEKVYINGHELHYIDPQVWLQRGYDGDSNAATPQWWTYNAQQELKLYPKPDINHLLQYTYVRDPQILTNDADVPLCNPVWHPAITYLALRYYGDFDEAPSVQNSAHLKFEHYYQGLTSDQLPKMGF